MAIESLTIEAVRGIRKELTLALGGASLLLRGDNGHGKSSIANALRWAVLGELPENVEPAAWRHKLESTARPRVEVALTKAGRIALCGDELEVDDAGAAFRQACQRANPFLVRRHLLRFLEDKPSERFQYLESFLDLEVADDVQTALETKAQSFDVAAKTQASNLQRALAPVVDSLPKLRRPSPASLGAVLDAISRWSSHLEYPTDWQQIKEIAAGLASLLEGEKLAQRRASLNDALKGLRGVVASVCPANLAPAIAALETAEKASTGADVASLLESALGYIGETVDDVCPVCVRPIDRVELSHAIGERLAELKQVREQRKRLDELVAAWRAYVSGFRAAVRIAQTALAPESPGEYRERELWMSLELALESRIAAHQLADLQGAVPIEPILQALVASVAAALESLPAEENIDDLRHFVFAVRSTSDAELALHLASQAYESSVQAARTLKLVSEAIRKARQDVARDLLREIGTLVAGYYGEIHPDDSADEVTGAPSIEVHRHGKGTAMVRGEFNHQKIDDPRALYSDGHLDTVGICVFLALRRFRADRDTTLDPHLMVLDDVVLSIDLTHAQRLIEVLNRHFADHQMLIFTHNGLFYDWCARSLNKVKMKRMAITRWTLEEGPMLGAYASPMERLRQSVEAENSPKTLAHNASSLMDEWLAEARFAYRIAVPAKSGESYTLTEIWNPFCAKIRKLQTAIGQPVADLTKVLADLEIPLPQMRNSLAAHYNEVALEFPLERVRGIARSCLALIDILHCSECDSFLRPRPDEKPESLVCDCDRLRYVRLSKARVEINKEPQ